MPKTSTIYDVVVIGGGPAGMMAAGKAAESGARVVLLEKNTSLGKKLLITGGGRCNVTNAEFDQHILLGKYKDSKKFLFSPFSQFGVESTFEFFQSRQMPMKVEAEKRAFPLSDKAQSVWDVLVKNMKENKVTILTQSPVNGFEVADQKITGVCLKSGEVVRAKSYILATGGKSRPETGSTGEGFAWLKKIGHTIIEPNYALVPIKIQEEWVHRLSGISLQDVKLTIFQDNKKQHSAIGKMLFTHFGLSGPLVLNMSKTVSELFRYAPVTLSLDVRPHQDNGAVDRELLAIFAENLNKRLKNSLGQFVPPAIAPVLISLANIDPEKEVNMVSREERMRLIQTLKNMPMTVQGLLGADKAVITSGGISLEEVDFKTMRSRLYQNLFVAGDVLNIDRPSGGYSLQLCWTTGYVAGINAATS